MDPPAGPAMYAQTPYYNPAYSPGVNAAGGIAGALIVASIAMEQQRHAQNRAVVANYENCMVARGWRVVRLTPAVGRRLEALSAARLEARLEPMIGAEQPEGEIVRTFSNDLAHPQSTPVHPDDGRLIPLSLLALPPQSIVADHLRRTPHAVPGMSRPIDEQRAADARERERVARIQRVREHSSDSAQRLLPVSDFTTLPADASLIVVSLSGAGRSIRFDRVPTADDHAPTAIYLTIPQPKAHSNEPVVNDAAYAFAVPAGRWRISDLSVGETTVSLCMGAPTFDVGQGEVVYAGAFGEAQTAPDMTPSAGQAVLASSPDLAARLRPASYTNGATFECAAETPFLYAYEVPNAPFADDYHWGSRFSPATAPATAASP